MEKFDYRKYIKNNKFTISEVPETRMINERFFMGGIVSTRPINNVFEKKKEVSEKKLDESKGDPLLLADTFARFLIGDRDAAIRQLQSMKNNDFGIMETPGSSEYNSQFGKLTKDIASAIKRNM